jgi:hypothetical protein
MLRVIILCVTNKYIMLTVVRLNVIMPTVMDPNLFMMLLQKCYTWGKGGKEGGHLENSNSDPS